MAIHADTPGRSSIDSTKLIKDAPTQGGGDNARGDARPEGVHGTAGKGCFKAMSGNAFTHDKIDERAAG